MSTPSHSGGDVAQTLDELERKLRELEHELSAAERGPVAPEPPPLVDPPARPVEPAWEPPRLTPAEVRPVTEQARERLGILAAEVDELARFREQLRTTARELEAEYARLLTRLGTAEPAAPAVAEPPLPQAPAEAPAPPAAHPFSGRVTLAAGPFADIAALGAFERALAGLPGVADVYVAGFEDRRAAIELELDRPVELAEPLSALAGPEGSVRRTAPGSLVVDLPTGG